MCLAALLAGLAAHPVLSQDIVGSRLAILQAEDRRAATPRDLATLRAGLRNPEPQIRLVAIRALGRLARPALIVDLLPMLAAPLPEVRTEAATAIGQASQGWGVAPGGTAAAPGPIASLVRSIDARLKIERHPDVRVALCEVLGRLPYVEPPDVDRAEERLVEIAEHGASMADRLGVAKGLEALERRQQQRHVPGAAAVAVLRRLAEPASGDTQGGARARRLAFEALTRADEADEATVERALNDQDPQVRRLAVRAARSRRLSEHAALAGLTDRVALVRVEALRTLGGRGSDTLCPAAVVAAADGAAHVALAALDQLRACGTSSDATNLLDRAVTDLSEAGSPRGWHRAAHALVAMASASPDRAARVLPQFTGSTIWHLRVYAARAAALLKNQAVLETLAMDRDDNVREAAIDGLIAIAGRDADAIFIKELTRTGYQVVRAAALALRGTDRTDLAIPALKQALTRLIEEGHDNSRDARAAIAEALAGLGVRSETTRVASSQQVPARPAFSAADLRRVASPRARLTIRSVGTIELALLTAQAPASVLRFVKLAQAGYYNGLTFHRVEPNFVVQGGSPGANEYIGDAMFMRDEVGQWPHVRGAVGVSSRGPDTGDAQFFIDLVDNPSFDHEYTVFGQVLNGLDRVDQILEGDVIESVEILR